ncbi:MAG: response regulator [Nitrospinaceae bacterium]|nr:response regulator [Nitrospina sp.]MBT5375809.1 response regulator [Nitrospinaceae bacterium]MBT5868899.1 response regulator [Nitrospinaceae bacterium]MBT6345301.1 response regulator [Nitrospina sp.]
MEGTSNPKLLVVDDNKMHCELARQFLTNRFDVEIALGGEEALAKIYNSNPEVVLLDIQMPRLTGDELVKMIKAWRPEVHVIMVSADMTTEIKDECLLNGALDCISKPINFQHLEKMIQKALNS